MVYYTLAAEDPKQLFLVSLIHSRGRISSVCEAVAHTIRTNSVAILVQVSWMPWMGECLEPCGSCKFVGAGFRLSSLHRIPFWLALLEMHGEGYRYAAQNEQQLP